MPDLAQAYRRFGEVNAVGTLYERVAIGLSESGDAMRVVASAQRKSPTVILAALHDLALAGRAPALAEAYAASDGNAAADAAIDTLLNLTGSLTFEKVRSDTGRHAVLYPATAEVARRLGSEAIGLIDGGCSAGFNLSVDRVGITYDNGQVLGDSASPVQVVGDRLIPTAQMPNVVARIGVDTDPLDVTVPNDARWLRACVWPDWLERRAMLDAIDRVLSGARPVAWVSAEGVGVAPSIPNSG